MQSTAPSRERLIDSLVVRGGLASLQDLADDVGLDASTTHRHLARLVREGAVEKHGRGKEVAYGLVPRVDVSWVGTSSGEQIPGLDHWMHWQWTGQGPVDWRFPLASRIQQEAGQRTMQRFLEHCWQHDLLGPLGIDTTPGGMDGLKEAQQWKSERIGRDMDRLRDGLTFVVFGSYARGDARRDSDLDVLVVTPPDWAVDDGIERPTDRLQDLVDEFNLWSPVSIDLVTWQRENPAEEFPRGLWRAISKEGMTVHSTTPGEYIEDFGQAWSRDADGEG